MKRGFWAAQKKSIHLINFEGSRSSGIVLPFEEKLATGCGCPQVGGDSCLSQRLKIVLLRGGVSVNDPDIWGLRREVWVLLEEEIKILESENGELSRLIEEKEKKIKQMEYRLLAIQGNMTHLGLFGRRVKKPFFDSSYYLKANPDVMEDGVDPVVHYLLNGHLEGRPVVPEKITLLSRMLFSFNKKPNNKR